MQIKNDYISRIIFFTNHYFGWRNWAVLVYNSIFENIFVLFYIALRNETSSIYFIIHFFFFLLFSSFCTTYGYLINDLGDKELDKIHGKDNTFKNDSGRKACFIVLFFLLLSFISCLPFIENAFFLSLWLSWLFICTAYSLKPFRLKEKGKIGLLLVVIAQRVLPALLMFSAFRHYNWIDIAIITSYIFFRGLSSDVNHQLEDYNNDSTTETDTYAVQTGIRKTKKIFRFSLEMEKALLFFCLLEMYFELPYLKIYDFPLILPLLLLYIMIYGLNLYTIFSHGKSIDVNPFIPDRKNIFQFIHHTFPTVLLSLYLLFLLIYIEWLFIILLLFFIIVRKFYSLEIILNSLPAMIIRNRFTKG